MQDGFFLMIILDKLLNFLAKIFSVVIVKGLVEKFLPRDNTYAGMLLLGVLAFTILLITLRR